MLDFLNSVKTCMYCNLSTETCFCPSSGDKNRLISLIVEKVVKNKKWLTTIVGSISKDDFKVLKDKLGTGGKYASDKIELRGKVLDRSKKILNLLGYYIC